MIAAMDAADKFDSSRSSEYETQARIALAGYDACHELAACMLAASLGSGSCATILVAGAGGTANEILTAGRLEPNWNFVAVDPSQAMLGQAVAGLTEAGLADRTETFLGVVDDLPARRLFDAATLMGVLHHLHGEEAKLNVLRQIASRLKPAAPLILALNCRVYASQPVMLAAWAERWCMKGATPEEARTKFEKIIQRVDPPHSEAAVEALLAEAGFRTPLRFFSSLFWSAWIVDRQ